MIKMTIDIAILTTVLGLIGALWRVGTIIANAIAMNDKVHSELRYEIERQHDAQEYELKELSGSHQRLKRRVSAIEAVINQHWNFKVRDSDITHNNFEDDE